MRSNPRPLARPQLGVLQVTPTPTLPGGHAGLTVKGRGPPQMPAVSGGLRLLGPPRPPTWLQIQGFPRPPFQFNNLLE